MCPRTHHPSHCKCASATVIMYSIQRICRVENNILTKKHQGYEYEHCYSYTWNAMEGYHYLMQIGRFLNVMAANSELLNARVKKYGIRGFIDRMNRVISGS